MIKTLLYIALACALSGTAVAQSLQLTVRNGHGDPMPYAYLYINGKAATVTDSCGKATVPHHKLTKGDTIAISYVGVKPQWVVYDTTLQQTGAYSFELTEIYRTYTADEIKVRADIEKLHRKTVNMTPPSIYNCILHSDFRMSFRQDSTLNSQARGTLSVGNEIWFRKPKDAPKKGWYHHPIRCTTSSDTARISEAMHIHTHFALNTLSRILRNVIYRKSQGNQKTHYSYLGKQDGCRIFRLTFPETQGPYAYQLLLQVDEKSKEVQSVALSRNQESYLHQFTILAECETYRCKKPPMTPTLITPTLHYHAETSSSAKIDIQLSNSAAGPTDDETISTPSPRAPSIKTTSSCI